MEVWGIPELKPVHVNGALELCCYCGKADIPKEGYNVERDKPLFLCYKIPVPDRSEIRIRWKHKTTNIQPGLGSLRKERQFIFKTRQLEVNKVHESSIAH